MGSARPSFDGRVLLLTVGGEVDVKECDGRWFSITRRLGLGLATREQKTHSEAMPLTLLKRGIGFVMKRSVSS